MPWIAPIIAGIGGAINAGVAAESAGQQERAFDDASEDVTEMLEDERKRFDNLAQQNSSALSQAFADAGGQFQSAASRQQQTLTGSTARAQSQLNRGFGTAQQQIGSGFGTALNQVGQGFGTARTDVQQATGAAAGALGQLSQIGPAQTAQAQGAGNVQRLLNDPSSFQEDPGFSSRS